MAGTVAPNIVTDGLVLYLDAANAKSYPGSGTTWFDISGNNNHVTLYNGVNFSSENGGYLIFDGTNDYAASINNINLTSYDYIAVEVFYKCNSSIVAMIFEHTADWNSNPGGFGLATNSNGGASVNNCNHTNHNTEVARNYLVTNNSIWSNNLNLYSKISDSTGRLTYVNGGLVDFSSLNGYPTSTITSPGGQFANAIFYIGSRAGSIIPFNGNISSLKMYGIKLPSQEILQNYNTIKTRFGL
jgi:hypothetical protein